MTYLAISSEEHAKSTYTPSSDYSFAQSIPACPAYLPELAELSAGYVICFMKQGDEYKLVALLGTAQTGSAFVSAEGRWISPYVPADIRGRPFALLTTPGIKEHVLCIDEHALNSDGTGEKLFNEAGELSEAVQKELQFLKQVLTASQSTTEAVSKLDKAGVIKEWEATLDAGKQKGTTKGLYCIDQSALNDLSAEDYYELRGAPMIISYAQAFSMRNVVRLNALLKAKAENQAQDFDFDSFLEQSESDTLQF